MGAVAMSANESPMAASSEPFHQLAMMIMAVLPLAKLSMNGPAVLASAVPSDGSVTPSSPTRRS